MYEYYVGMDVGGTHVRIAYKKSNEQSYSKIIKKKFVRCETVIEELEKNIIQLIDYVIKINSQAKLVGIGIAMAPLIDKKTGVIKEWPNNIKWREVPILELLKSTYGIEVVIEDDANAAALGEKLVGNAINRENFVYVTISTGIGCAIVLNNRLLVGEHGWCGELGHIRVSTSTERCNCGATGCLQAIASGPAILRYYKSITGIQNVSLNEIANEAMNGKKEAVQVIKEATKNIGLAISNLVILLDISLIIIGGGVLNLGNIFTGYLEEEIYTNLFERREVELKYSQLTDVNGVYGAISIIMDRMKK